MKAFTFEAIGTRWVIDYLTEKDSAAVESVFTEVQRVIADFDQQYSRFRNDSFVHSLAQKSGTFPLREDGEAMLRLYRTLYQVTDGAVTPLIGSVLEEAGYDPSYSLTPRVLHAPPSFPEIITFDRTSLTLTQPAVLDFGALGKGKLIDIVSEVLIDAGISEFCVDAGGDMLYHSEQNLVLKVGLENPENTEKVLGVVSLSGGSIAGSAGNRRKWGKYHHIIDPRSLTPVENILAVWAIAETAMLADAMATALFFTEPKKLQKHFTFSYLILYPDFHIYSSEDFPAEMFYTKQ